MRELPSANGAVEGDGAVADGADAVASTTTCQAHSVARDADLMKRSASTDESLATTTNRLT